MIGFPFHGDQKYNAIRIKYKGYGLAMNIFEFTADELLSNILKILNDQAYTVRVSQASEIFKSAVENPVERAASGIEHVAKFGDEHLRSAGKDLPMYQYLLLDVLATLAAACVIPIVVLYKMTRFCFKKGWMLQRQFNNDNAKKCK